MEEKTCFFTGHRNIVKKDYERICYLTKVIVEMLIQQKGVTNFKIGGARGFDSIVFLVLLELKNIYPHIKLILVLPCKDQNLNWCKKDNELYYKILENADEVIYLQEKYTKDCMLKRNDKLIENSLYCVTFFREHIKRGGTFYIINRAIKKDIKIYNIFDCL